MQGTIKTYDATKKSGIILDDAANEIAFDHESFRTTGMRLFRLGQRVSFTIAGEGAKAKVRDLRILTVY
jgi:cold shock CspA family protein